MQIDFVHTGFFKLDGGAMFGIVPKVMWEKKNAPDANNLCQWAARCLLIRDKGRVILVDTGLGGTCLNSGKLLGRITSWRNSLERLTKSIEVPGTELRFRFYPDRPGITGTDSFLVVRRSKEAGDY